MWRTKNQIQPQALLHRVTNNHESSPQRVIDAKRPCAVGGGCSVCPSKDEQKTPPSHCPHDYETSRNHARSVCIYIYMYIYVYIRIYCIVCKLVGTVVGFGRVLAPVFVKSVDACERIPRQRGGTSKGIPLLYGYTAIVETFPHAGGVYPHYGGIYPSMGVYPQSGGIHTPI